VHFTSGKERLPPQHLDWVFECSWRREKSLASARNLTLDCPVYTIVVTLSVLTLFLGGSRYLCNVDTCAAY